MKTYKILRTGLQPLVFDGKLLAEATGDHYRLQVFLTTGARYVAVAGRVQDGFQAATVVPTLDGVVDILSLFDGRSEYVSTFTCVATDNGLFQAERVRLVDNIFRQLGNHGASVRSP